MCFELASSQALIDIGFMPRGGTRTLGCCGFRVRDALSSMARARGDAIGWFFCVLDEERAVATPEWLEFSFESLCLSDETLAVLVRAK